MSEVLEQLAVVTEELRVADEELRSQQELIESLIRGRLAEQLAATRLTAAIPVAIVDTDVAGIVLRANPAAGALLRVEPGRLRGKPLLAYVHYDDRRAVRTAMTRATAEASAAHLVARLTPRHDGTVPAELAVLPARPQPSDTGGRNAAARWVLAPQVTATVPDTLAALAEVAALPVVTGDLRDVLVRAAALAVRGLAGAEAASVTLGPPAEATLLATTDALAQAIDGAQFRAARGPSWDAYAGRAPVTTADLRTDGRWPGLPALLPAAGAGAVAAPLLEGTVQVGVLAVYGTAAVGRAEVAARAALFATAATAIVREHRAIDELRRAEGQLREALVSRATIDQAKGILMARHGYDPDEAFAELIRASQHGNVKLRTVAQRLVEDATGSAPAAGQPAAPDLPASARTGSDPARAPSAGLPSGPDPSDPTGPTRSR